MPTVRLVNGRFQGRRKAPKTINMRKRRASNGGLTYVMNKRRSNKRRSMTAVPARRHRNPTVVYRRRGNRRRNPGEVMGILEQGLTAAVGGVLTRSIPGMLMSDTTNTGAAGYAANAATGVALYMGGKALGSERTANMLAVGSVVMIVGRVISDYFGQNLISFGQVTLPGGATTSTSSMSGDPAFTFGRRKRMSGAYAQPYNFTIPFNSAPTDPAFAYAGLQPSMPMLPPAPMPAKAAAPKMGNGGIWDGPWGGGN